MKSEGMFIYIVILSFGVLMGISMSLAFIFFGKLKKYILRKKEKTQRMYVKALDILWRLLLPIVFGIISLAIPAKVIYMVLNRVYGIENTSSFFLIYLYAFLFSLGIFIFILVKLGKMKVTTKWPPD